MNVGLCRVIGWNVVEPMLMFSEDGKRLSHDRLVNDGECVTVWRP